MLVNVPKFPSSSHGKSPGKKYHGMGFSHHFSQVGEVEFQLRPGESVSSWGYPQLSIKIDGCSMK